MIRNDGFRVMHVHRKKQRGALRKKIVGERGRRGRTRWMREDRGLSG
jgi:hypothetical protein